MKKRGKTRFVRRDHWEDLLARYSGEGDGSVWVDETGEGLEEVLREKWKTVKPGGFMGGPSWGCGPLEDGRFVMDSRTGVDRFMASTPDASEMFLTDEHHRGWMIYKVGGVRERVLLVSGCDRRQMNFFGKLTQRNHEYYAAYQGYDTRWHLWDEETWGRTREELVWAKLKVVADALEEGCWDQVWWVDADAAFINRERRIDRYLHPRCDGVFAEFLRDERVMYSTGIFGCRRGAGPLLRAVWETGGVCEEEAVTAAAVADPEGWGRMLLVSHTLFNGFYGWNVDFSDPPSTFTCHLVSQTNQTRRWVFRGINEALGIFG
ncbi:MAG: hypothetical protein ACSHYF_10625 [Verrucomicrobiaceae bacterium]